MGPPLRRMKPFLKLSQQQQKRRIRALVQADLAYLANAANNAASSPTRPPSCSPPTARASNIPDDVCHQIDDFFERFDDAEDLNLLINERPTLTNTDIQLENQAQSTITRPISITNLQDFLAHWAIQNKIPQSVVNDLLRGLKKFGHPELPSDARTLCDTPNRTDIQALAGGTYVHYGLERALKEQLRKYNVLLQRNSDTEISVILQININIDGLPLSKSSKSQLWPILGKVVGTQFVEPFVIGAFHGNKKPSSAAQFLQAFFTEYMKLYNEGFIYENRSYFVRLNAILADTPARNFISCFPAHNSRCAKCIQPGKTVNGRRIFLEKDSTLRTNATFREGLPAAFLNIMSPFEIIGIIDMIKQFPLDYMHLLCLGTMKKLLLLWIRAMGKSEEALAKLAAFNDFYRRLAKSVPAEFSRHPRSLEEVAQWKATEFRLFLLYLGPVVLQHLLSKPQIIHFNVLNCAVRILCDPRECVRNNSYAQDLMIYFVDNMELLYGEETLIYNIHNLIHIPEDVLNHGPLDSFSCFPFENFLQKIKLMIKGGAQPLAQFIKRITERSIHLIPSDNSKTGYNYLNKRKNRLDDHQLPPGYTNFHQEIQFQDFLLTDKSPNNCCYLSNNSVVLVEHICCYKEIPVIVGRQFINTHSIADYPCDSRNLGIFDGRELSELQTWNIDEIDRKGFVVPYDADSVFKTYIMTHPDSLHQRNWRKRPRFLFRFSRQPIFHITDLHILLVNSQDMAAIQKHHNKQKKLMPSQASKGISQAKIIKIRNMYLPPNKFKAGTDTANILNNSGVQIIENSSVAPVQNANKKYVSQLQKRSAQKIPTSSPIHQDHTILEYLQDNAETAEEQDDEYTYTEFLEDSSNDEVVGNDEVVENDEVRENDEVVENDEENNNQGDDALDNDEVIVNRENRPEIHPHDAAVCCIQESILELDSDTETYSSLEANKSLHKNNQPTSPSIFAHLKKRPKQSRLAFYSVKNSETVTENSAATFIVNNTIEISANINNNMDNFNLDDTENKPLKKKRWSKRKDIPKQLNMRCKADRAKLKGQDCWECREYYKMLSLSEEEIQKRKNQCSRHRRQYERPNTPEDGCRQERKDFENCILQKLNELLEVGQRNDNPVERIDRHHYALLPQMPFTDINELQRFDRDLKDNGQIRDQFMKKIQDIGGKSVQKAVKYAMEVVMTDDLTQQVVWTLGAENKPKISKFTFPYVIIDIVRNTFEGTKIKTVEDRIAEWLRRGGDRKKAENKRRERQNLQHQ